MEKLAMKQRLNLKRKKESLRAFFFNEGYTETDIQLELIKSLQYYTPEENKYLLQLIEEDSELYEILFIVIKEYNTFGMTGLIGEPERPQPGIIEDEEPERPLTIKESFNLLIEAIQRRFGRR